MQPAPVQQLLLSLRMAYPRSHIGATPSCIMVFALIKPWDSPSFSLIGDLAAPFIASHHDFSLSLSRFSHILLSPLSPLSLLYITLIILPFQTSPPLLVCSLTPASHSYLLLSLPQKNIFVPNPPSRLAALSAACFRFSSSIFPAVSNSLASITARSLLRLAARLFASTALALYCCGVSLWMVRARALCTASR